VAGPPNNHSVESNGLAILLRFMLDLPDSCRWLFSSHHPGAFDALGEEDGSILLSYGVASGFDVFTIPGTGRFRHSRPEWRWSLRGCLKTNPLILFGMESW